MITIQIPSSYESERRYILTLLFREFLNLNVQIQLADRRDVQITTGDGRKLVIADGLFGVPEDRWLRPSSLPRQPLKVWNLKTAAIAPLTVTTSIPVIYGRDPASDDFYSVTDGRIDLGLDIFGATFFMLTRYEEVAKPDRDKRGRFPAAASLAHQEGFLDRPIVNEYLEILWACLTKLWPRLQRKPRDFRSLLSHDVDVPLCIVGRNFPRVLVSTAGDVVKRKKPSLARRRLGSFLRVRRGGPDADLCNTFDFIMGLSEKHGLKSSFYFITDRSAGKVDGSYSIADPWIRGVLRSIHGRGHEIGLHPSYNSFQNPQKIRRELDILLEVAEAENIRQEEWGGRQHFLRWEAPITWQAWEDAGLDYDSTLSFADHAGFRCGICYEYQVFDLMARRPLNLRERPLIVMETTILDKKYMHLTTDRALQEVRKLLERCKTFDGDFTLLWHNSELIDKQVMALYRDIVEGF